MVVPAIANIDVIKIPMLINQSLVQIGKTIGLARWKLCLKVFADDDFSFIETLRGDKVQKVDRSG